MDSNKICAITNRSAGYVGYSLPERNIRRKFAPKETKKVPYYEIEEVLAQSGGERLLKNYFYIENVEEILDMKPEPEYFLTEDKIDSWMTTCSLDEFKDALDFAPSGVKDLIKTHAVSLPLNDIAKCEAIQKQLGLNVLQAIKNEKATVADDEEKQETPKRRVEIKEEKPANRRVSVR